MRHTCHWSGCGKPVPAAMWGCTTHWFVLPKFLRDRIWRTYRPGQEVTKTPSAEYVKVAQEVRRWVADYQSRALCEPLPSGARALSVSPSALQGTNLNDISTLDGT